MRARVRQSAGELLHEEIAAQGRVERLRAHSLVSKRRVVSIPGEFAVHLEGGNGHRRLDEHLVGNGEMIPRRVLHHEALRDHALEQLQAERGRIEHRRIEVPPEHSAHAVLLLPQRFAEFLLGDLLPADARDFARARRSRWVHCIPQNANGGTIISASTNCRRRLCLLTKSNMVS